MHYSNGITLKSEWLILLHVNKTSQGILILVSSHDNVVAAKENVAIKANMPMKATLVAKVALEATAHATRVVAFVQVELKRRKTTNAQPRFFESSSKLLQTFVAPDNQTKKCIREDRGEGKKDRRGPYKT